MTERQIVGERKKKKMETRMRGWRTKNRHPVLIKACPRKPHFSIKRFNSKFPVTYFVPKQIGATANEIEADRY